MQPIESSEVPRVQPIETSQDPSTETYGRDDLQSKDIEDLK